MPPSTTDSTASVPVEVRTRDHENIASVVLRGLQLWYGDCRFRWMAYKPGGGMRGAPATRCWVVLRSVLRSVRGFPDAAVLVFAVVTLAVR